MNINDSNHKNGSHNHQIVEKCIDGNPNSYDQTKSKTFSGFIFFVIISFFLILIGLLIYFVCVAFNNKNDVSQEYFDCSFEQGNLDGTYGQPISANNAVRTVSYINEGTYTIRSSGQLFYVYVYDLDGNRSSNPSAYVWGANSDLVCIVPKDKKIRVVVMQQDKSDFNPSECTVYFTKFKNVYSNSVKNGFITICHQGYSAEDSLGRNRLSGFALAKEVGFDWAECDLKLTRDNQLVCCHDATFIDQSSKQTISIEDFTLEELKKFNYYGESIASFDEVLFVCKTNKIGLVIDQIPPKAVDLMFSVVKKYSMQRKVAYTLIDNYDYPNYISDIYNQIVKCDPYAHVMVISYPNTIEHAIAFCNNVVKNDNKVDLYIPYTSFDINQIVSIQGNLDRRVNISIWTIDDLTIAKSYLPYVSAICSNKISTNSLNIKKTGFGFWRKYVVEAESA